MNFDKPINLFYQEPDPDRWLKYDRYPRRIIRKLIRGKQRPGGVAMIAINLIKGLDKLGVPYRLNDFRHIQKHPDEIACIIGKPHVIFNRKWENPILFGAGIYSHPVECPDLFTKYPNIKRILVPGPWIKNMFEPFYPGKVLPWPAGIDTDEWTDKIKTEPEIDFLIYDKVWQKDDGPALLDCLCQELKRRSLSYDLIKYGNYKPGDLVQQLRRTKSAIFLSESETQGLAYQQILATDTPIMAWDRGGYWQDPFYYPRIQFAPVSSVPYWDDRCGQKFSSIGDFGPALDTFLANIDSFNPRAYVLENLTLEKCAEQYLKIFRQVQNELS